MLSREDLAEVAALFDAVVDLPAPERTAVLEDRCAARPGIRAEIDSLLSAHDRTGDFLRPVGLEGAVIGAWRIRDRIGAGGMGEVYLVERADGAYAGRAAIKIMRAHLRDTDAVRRFRSERQILASLQHPGIVTLLDGGTTSDGQPYLVMELVEGMRISEYCRVQQPGLEARLHLMQRVADAVQFAHQRGIVHRDLKPTNILVTPDGTPKVLDFGIAKLIEGADAATTQTSVLGPLTPNYASPEQLRGLPVTTACDVYSLGVLLYELLGGARPYDTSGMTLDAVMTTVVDTQPARPSTEIAGAQPLPYARSRLRGDLDAIVLKALRKEPEHRYGSAGGLSDDIGRFLRHEPVIAREPSASYLLRRLATRHRAAVAIAAAALVAIVAALGVAVWQRQVAVGAQRRAETRFREVRQLSQALIFKLHDSVAKLPGSTPVRRQIVDEALVYLERLAHESADDLTLRMELGGAYRQIARILGDPAFPNLGDTKGALVQAQKSLDRLNPVGRARDASPQAVTSLVDTLTLLRRLLASTGDRAQALAMAEDAVRVSQGAMDRGLPEGKKLLASSTFALAGMVQPLEAKIPHWQRTAQLYEQLLAEKPGDPERMRNVALVGRNFGGLLTTLKRPGEARPMLERSLALDHQRMAAAPDDRMAQLDTAIEYSQLATLSEADGDIPGALALHEKSLALRQRLAESDPKDALTRNRLAWTRTRLARLHLRNNDAQRALPYAQDAVVDLEPAPGTAMSQSAREDFGSAIEALGEAAWAAGNRATACRHFTRAIDVLTPHPEGEKNYYLGLARARAATCGPPRYASGTEGKR